MGGTKKGDDDDNDMMAFMDEDPSDLPDALGAEMPTPMLKKPMRKKRMAKPMGGPY